MILSCCSNYLYECHSMFHRKYKEKTMLLQAKVLVVFLLGFLPLAVATSSISRTLPLEEGNFLFIAKSRQNNVRIIMFITKFILCK
jgi:hypothetical protein